LNYAPYATLRLCPATGTVSTTQKALTRFRALFILVPLTFGHPRLAKAHDNCEIQLSGFDTIVPKKTMLQVPSHFTVGGSSRIRAPRSH
jgi:hypothetical protein